MDPFELHRQTKAQGHLDFDEPAPESKPAPEPDPESAFGPVICAYSRKQAIKDGVLVDLMQPETVQLVREAGFTFPVAMTAAAFNDAVAPIDGELPEGQDLNGRLWDVLFVLKCAIKASKGGDTVRFKVSVWNGRKRNTVRLWSRCGPGDDMEPVITIMLEGED